MLYPLFNFYKHELSTYNLVFKHMRFWFYLFLIIPIALFILLILSFVFFNNYLISVITSVFMFSINFGLYTIFNKKAKAVVKAKYNISPDGRAWNSPNVLLVLRKHEKKRLLEYISKANDQRDNIDLKNLSESALSESERMKVKFPVVPSVFATIFVSLLNNFFGWLFKQDSLNSITDAVILLGIISYCIFVLIMLYIMFSSVYSTIRDDILNRDSRKMKMLSEIIKELDIDIQKG